MRAPPMRRAQDAPDVVEAVAPSERVGACLERIDSLDRVLQAWAAVDRDRAIATARELDGERPVLPLHGVPVGVKDNIATAGLRTRAGSSLFEDHVPSQDAEAVSRLRQAGAVVLGKTACTELATNDPAPTRNPWRRAHSPGGSSPGSAVAVATGMALASVDTQTAGDILRPAAYNGVVGLKPTYGQISRRGVMPVAWSIDTVGVQARSVADAATVLTALAGHADQRRSATEAAPDPAAALEPAARSPRIGVPRDELYERAEPEVGRHTDEVLAALADAGADVRYVGLREELALVHAAHRVVTFSECAALHERLFARRAAEMGPKLRTLIELGLVTPAAAYLDAQRVRARFVAGAEHALRDVDALLTPTASGPAPRDLSTTGDSSFQIPWTFGGFPAISIPTGLSSAGLPLAIQLVGGLFEEERLVRVARWCERALAVELPEPPEACAPR